ncbi:right-handed parallel beta-helix repeat-containing protein [Paraherbaspirillum soli]|uniref:Right-handed parallel beta-helix repeat-containing protein n=2 Tax=Paraherbaspirillum soli TaxID=631222 RepID=A0ABW0MB44_9BURK
MEAEEIAFTPAFVFREFILKNPQADQRSQADAAKSEPTHSSADAQNDSDSGCAVLRWDKASFNKPYIAIRKPGRYCLDQDYDFSCSPWTHGCGGNFIDIEADDVDVDLRGHTLSTSGTRGYAGIKGHGKNIRIHHGTMKGVGTGIKLAQRSTNWQMAPVYSYPAYPTLPIAQFTETRFVIENVNFIDVYSPILLSGAGNVIRNNQIGAILDNRFDEDGAPKFAGEDEPKVSVLNSGPKALIEYNTISQKTDNHGIAAYTLYLRNGDGSIVRNNRIRVDGSTDKTIAVGLSNSRNVLVQDNIFAKAETPIEIKDGRTAKESGNKVNSSFSLW